MKNEKIPTHLSHYPIIGVGGYNKVDGIYKEADSDAMALSIGVAQYDKAKDWNERGISAKVFRRPNGRWSAQSEELPLHRTFDLSTLTLKALLMCAEMDVPQTECINPCVVNGASKERVKAFYVEHRKEILPKIKELQEVINSFMAHEPEIK